MDEYLEKLKAVQDEIKGIDMRMSALENGYVLDAEFVDQYIEQQRSNAPARYEDFLSKDDLIRIQNDYLTSLNKGADCDALDYGLAAVIGIFCGVIDALFTSNPHEGIVSEKTDDLFDKIIMALARKNGWNPKEEKKNSVASAIGFLESHYGVVYDQAKSKDVLGAVEHMRTRNHHAKSAGHYPDIFGLIASICNQFTGTSTFYDQKKKFVYMVNTEDKHELHGDTFVGKVFCGTANWFWHCISDIAGSSGSRGKGKGHIGAGLPIPFTELFQLCDFGKFENEKGQWQSFATVMTKVYEEGYDARHAATMSVPVILNELLIRAIYTIKRHFYNGLEWNKILLEKEKYSLKRMLTVSVGTMCLVDAGHATVSSWGNWVKFFSELNLVSWSRFGLLAVGELQMMVDKENRNIVAIQDTISERWDELLEKSRMLLE